jgi:ribosomal protein L16 Arg81 hydroxylase
MTFESLLGEMSPAAFVRDFYHRLPLARSGTAQGGSSIGNWDLVGRLLASPDADVLVVRRNERVPGVRPASLDEAKAVCDEGCTILVRHAEQHDEALQALAADFRRQLGGTVDIHLYATPASEFGFSWHYDAEEVFIVQTLGAKEYSLRKNTVNPWPVEEALPANMAYEREIMPLSRCQLRQGDVLYIPSGYWHKAVATEMSLALAIGVTPRTAIEVFDFLRPRVVASLLWRQRLPVDGAAAALDETGRREYLRNLFVSLGEDLKKMLSSEELLESFVERSPHDSSAAGR